MDVYGQEFAHFCLNLFHSSTIVDMHNKNGEYFASCFVEEITFVYVPHLCISFFFFVNNYIIWIWAKKVEILVHQIYQYAFKKGFISGWDTFLWTSYKMIFTIDLSFAKMLAVDFLELKDGIWTEIGNC